MGKWNHSICEDCWVGREGNREPVRLSAEMMPDREFHCCFCAAHHRSGIFVREDPDLTRCKGVEMDHELGMWA